MRAARYLILALLFALFSALTAMVVSIVATAILDNGVSGRALLSAAFTGAAMFVVGFLTVLFVWPRVGFDPFKSQDQRHLPG